MTGIRNIGMTAELLARLSPAERAQAWSILYDKAGARTEALFPIPFDGRAQQVEGMNLIPFGAKARE